MTRRPNPPLPSTRFALLLVEGGDERAVCDAILGSLASRQVVCWHGNGRTDLPSLAALAARDPNIGLARAIGVVLDMEDATDAYDLAKDTLAAFGRSGRPIHAAFTGAPPAGAFLSPDGAAQGAIETLCRQAVRDPALAYCLDSLATCAGNPHPNVALADKGWLYAYLAMLDDPTLRFYQAFTHPRGIDALHGAFDPLRSFLTSL
jgi:hypothetical protein